MTNLNPEIEKEFDDKFNNKLTHFESFDDGEGGYETFGELGLCKDIKQFIAEKIKESVKQARIDELKRIKEKSFECQEYDVIENMVGLTRTVVEVKDIDKRLKELKG